MNTVMDHKYIAPICHERGCQYLVLQKYGDLAEISPTPSHFVSASCQGEHCAVCHQPATHKLEEAIQHDDPNPIRHELTAYVCCRHFRMIVGGSCL